MGTFFVFMVLCGVSLSLQRWLKRKRVLRAAPRWSNSMSFDLPEGVVRDAVFRLVRENGYVLERAGDGTDIYSRGDRSLRRLPGPRGVSWQEIPILLGVGVGAAEGRSVVFMGFTAWPGVEYSPQAAAQFRTWAMDEFEQAQGLLERLARGYRSESEKARRPKHRWYPEDGGGQPSESAADFAALGLRPGASWTQVQVAYREACRKYHPDRLSGQNLAPHVVELAVQRFQDATAAYQRLKDRTGGAARA